MERERKKAEREAIMKGGYRTRALRTVTCDLPRASGEGSKVSAIKVAKGGNAVFKAGDTRYAACSV